MRDFILSEIRRIASENGGVAPGQGAFTSATGITSGKWRGVHWVRWSDALTEAGFCPNEWIKKLDSEQLLLALAAFTRELRRLPTRSEIKMRRRTHGEFPSHSTVSNHFRTNSDMAEALLRLAQTDDGWADLSKYLPVEAPSSEHSLRSSKTDGFVYLLKSGRHHKIGRSEDIERRFREVKVALPEAVTLIHTIRTDDPSGIEAYWHRRFADRRANGEWFALTSDDVRAFQKRTYQ